MAELQHEWYLANRERRQDQIAQRLAEDPSYRARQSKKSYWKNPERAREMARARNAVSYAIRVGRLERQPCEVCATTVRVQAHHDDYSKPLDVRWLCSQHHVDHHLEIKKAKKTK